MWSHKVLKHAAAQTNLRNTVKEARDQNVIGFHLSHPGQVSPYDKEEHSVVIRVEDGSDEGGQKEGWGAEMNLLCLGVVVSLQFTC